MISENLKQIYDSIINSIQTKGINSADLQDLLVVAADGFKEDEQWAKKVTAYIKQCCEYSMHMNREILQMDALWWETMKVEAPYLFESFLFYMEKNRRPEKRFYEPRKRTLHIVVQDLQDLEDGLLKFLGISLPPRVGKSTLCIFFLAWVIGRHPESHNAMSGHSGILADRFYRDVFKLTQNEEYTFREIFPDCQLVNKSSDKNELFFSPTEAFATLTARGIDGTWTGAVDISSDGYLYVDDMVRDRTESLSPVRLENRYQDYLNVLVDRKNDGSKELMVGTRWNVLDPLGRVEADNKDNSRYRFRKIPALNEKDESNFQYDYGKGFSAEYYRDMRNRLDKNEWMAKYQQMPFIREGILFPADELNYYNGVLPDGEYVTVEACDPAFGGEDHLSMPVGIMLKDDPDGKIYIPDWLFIKGDKDKTAPLIVSKSIANTATRLRIEGNNGGTLYADFVDEKFKEVGYKISITTQLASNKMSKTEKILLYSADIKRRCYFLEEKLQPPEYREAMEEMQMYTQTGKNPHEDSVDSLVQLMQFTEDITPRTQVINSPF